MILVIDNYDSFVYNLARHMELAGWACRVARNDKITIKDIEAMKPEAIVISPGPCAPEQSGICTDAVKHFGPTVPILGVCLGHQCIGEAYGARTVRAAKPVHGKASLIHHTSDPLFANIPNPFKAGRYHSLVIRPPTHTLPPMGGGIKGGGEKHGEQYFPLLVTAQTPEGDIMAVKHESFPTYGVQFHPESVLTEHGMQVVTNFTALAMAWNSRKIAA